MPGIERTVDVVVIGAGPTGENAADRVARGGLEVAIVERELVGGECSYWACMPTKALLRSSSALRAARALPGAASAVTGELDVDAVLARRDRFASGWDDAGQVSWLASAGIDLVRGQARVVGPRRVEVSGAEGIVLLTARHAVVVATGTSALVPPIPGLDGASPWTSREAASSAAVPASLAIIGGGVVATEMATAYTALGSAVTLLARDGVLPSAEPFVGEMVTTSLEDAGVRVRPGAEVVHAARSEGRVVLTLADGGRVDADEVLVAVGRTPNTAGLGLDSVGLADGGWLRVDETMRVTDASGEAWTDGWLYAVGDVNARALVTHQGKYQARAAGDAIVSRAHRVAVDDRPWGWHVATADHSAVPQVVFTDPEVASVGLTAAAAEAEGYATRVVDHDLGAVAGAALHADGYRGRARMVVDTDREVVLGVTLVGPDVGELIHAATIAVTAEVPIERLWHAVPAYPTVSELWLRLLEAYGRPTPGPLADPAPPLHDDIHNDIHDIKEKNMGGSLYTAVATSTGDGRAGGRARSDDGQLDVVLAIPKEMGGPGGATNPEQLFAAGWASCFHSALKLVASQRHVTIADSAVVAEVEVRPTDAGGFGLAAALHVELSGVTQEQADELVAAAHEVCPYSNATRGNIPVTVDATVD